MRIQLFRTFFILFRRYTAIKELQINGQIKDREVRVIGADGTQLGIMSNAEAQRLADELSMDLAKISPNATPPVCKIMDYGKYRYEQIKREKEARKNQKIIELKEIRLSMNIDDNDIRIKAKNAAKFLKEGDKVKVSLRMRGRQTAYAENARQVVLSFYEILKDISQIEKKPVTEWRNITMILAPLTTK